ncbi:hypothetical protein KEM54_003994 [Ascosphaera aggregata]|nr:hypothetical protein KEM54_003994 [Ascosphaera aggregata]
MMSRIFTTYSFSSHKNRPAEQSPEPLDKASNTAPTRNNRLNYFRRHGERISTSREHSPKRSPSPNSLASLFGPAATACSVWRRKRIKPEDVLLAANADGTLLAQIAAAMKEPALQEGLCFDSVLRGGILIIVTSPDGHTSLGQCDYEERDKVL